MKKYGFRNIYRKGAPNIEREERVALFFQFLEDYPAIFVYKFAQECCMSKENMRDIKASKTSISKRLWPKIWKAMCKYGYKPPYIQS